MNTFTMPLQGKAFRTFTWECTPDHERQADRNHGQSLETLKSRHGMGFSEMVAIIECRRWHWMNEPDAIDRLKELGTLI